MFGRNDKSCMGVAGVDEISENEPRRLTAQELGAPADVHFVHAACGRNHTLLVGSDGQLWTAGQNHAGQVSQFYCGVIESSSERAICVVWSLCVSRDSVVQASQRAEA